MNQKIIVKIPKICSKPKYLDSNIEYIAKILKGKLLQFTEDIAIEHLLLDSRKIVFPATSIFFALSSARRDGHQYLEEVYEKGVRNFVIAKEINVEHFPAANIISVKNTLHALQTLAADHRKKFSIPVIGITGSNGKTIVKELLNQLLEPDFNIVRSPRSYNSQIGVPLSVWQMSREHTLGIFEAGISQSGEMEKLEKIIQPTIGIFTNVGEAHSEGFINVRQKVNEKLQLFKNAETLIYCKDYPEINEGIAAYLQPLRSNTQLKYFNWSTKTEATLQITSILKSDNATYITAGKEKLGEISIQVPFTDDAYVENAITCWCVMLQMGIRQEIIENRMLQLNAVPMRLELIKGINNCSIINDSYSADLSSLRIALDFLTQQQQHSKRTVILSDILQSGKTDKQLYDEVAGALAQKNINRLIGIGENIQRHYKSFEKISGMELHFYPSTEAFRKDFYHLHFSHEAILLKGARVFAFEQISLLLQQKVHQTVMEINLDALSHNLKEYQKILQPTTRLMAMVKAFSYGSGSYEIANLLQFHKVDYLAVAYADEGVELRKGGIKLPVMVMNPEESTYDALLQFDLEPDIYSLEQLQHFDTFLKQQNIHQFPVHIELETGMNRLGFSLNDLDALKQALVKSSFKVQSVFSHLAASEDPEQDAFTQMQGEKFLQACASLEQSLTYPFIKHLANSAAIIRHPQWQLDMVRLGIGLYGIDSASSKTLDLQEVSSLKTTIAQVKTIKAGESVGYGRRAKAKADMVIATARLGYADGYSRRLGHGVGKMLVKGKMAPVIGSVCMDMTMLDITKIPGVKEGDEVTVFGAGLSLETLARWAETIPYEIMTTVSQRVKRVYYGN